MIDKFFANGGPLAKVFASYEARAEQVAVAQAVADTMQRGGTLLAEAGTGTGKTLAYLVPAVLSGMRVVVSTATKNLQEQIVTSDLPILERALGTAVETQVMKGRTNYLCLTRLAQVRAQPFLPGVGDANLLDELLPWAERTTTGDRSELTSLKDDSSLWRELTATGEQCSGRACRAYESCYVTEMRRRAQTVPLIIVNHHLYFADLALRARTTEGNIALLPAHDVVIFDEAHELEEIASQHFGYHVSDRRVFELTRDVSRATDSDMELSRRLARLLGELDREATRFFDALPYGDGRMALGEDDAPKAFGEPYNTLVERLDRLSAELGLSRHDDAPGLLRRTNALAADLRFIVDEAPLARHRDPHDADKSWDDSPQQGLVYVRLCERMGRHRAIMARPVEVAPLLRKALSPTPSVFISATLSVRKSFTYTRARLGIRDDAQELLVDSPFDYDQAVRLYVPGDLPEPELPSFSEAAAERARDLVLASQGGAFLLCTSHRALGIFRRALEDTGLHLLQQGDAPKSALLDEFKAHGDAVLIATQSFWQGVDVPGQALRLVVIDKLPFASPVDPIVKARLDAMRARGLEPFPTYQLPQATLLLRQGFGRLVRNKSDRGMVAILDRRLHERSYGRGILASLPRCPRTNDLRTAVGWLTNERQGAFASAAASP